MFNVEASTTSSRARGAEVIGEMQYQDLYRLAYLRGPGGIVVGLAEQTLSHDPASWPSFRTQSAEGEGGQRYFLAYCAPDA